MRNLKMSIRILVILQLVSAILGFRIQSLVNNKLISIPLDAATGLLEEVMDETRHTQELLKFPTGLGVYDDDNELVEITNHESTSTEFKGRITFSLYTKKNSANGQELQINDTASLKRSNFDGNKPTYFITHGWRNTGSSNSCVLIRDAYVSNTDSNVIVVNWSKYSMTNNYIDASYKTKVAGQKVGDMINYLYRNGLTPDKVTLIGHSLGAHVMGIAGYSVRPNKVDHIVGLDPALPMFRFAGPGEALSMKDAEHVHIIHTNAGALGYVCPRGHSDFFPNGGIKQAGCCGLNIMHCAACSHERAYRYFAESITKSFNAIRCDSYASFESNYCGAHAHTAPMGGLDLDAITPGTYYLRTGYKPPFSIPRQRSIIELDVTPFFANVFCEVLPI